MHAGQTMRAEEKTAGTAIPKARSIDWLIALGLFLLYTAVYWLTISKNPGIDSYVTAYWVKSTAQCNWFHPHHLLFSYACRLVNLVYQALFPPCDMLMLFTRCMHILGGLCIALFYLRLYAFKTPRLLAAAVALLIGGGYGIWLYATMFELVIPYVAMFLAAWAAAHHWGGAGRWGVFAAGMVLGAGVLIHQTLVIYLPAFLIFIFMLGEHRTRWRRALYYGLGCAIVTCIGYLTAFLVLGLGFPAGWFQFFTAYAQTEAFKHGTWADILTSAKNIVAMWFYPLLYADYISLRVLAALAALLILVAIAIFRSLRKDPLSIFSLIIFGIAFIFFTWWSPTTLDFYVIPSIIIVLPAILWIKWRYFPAVILVLWGWVFVFNNLPEMQKNTAPLVDCVMETDRRLLAQLRSEDKVFFADQHLEACAAYLEMPAEYHLAVKGLNSDEEMIRFAEYAKDACNYAVYYDDSFKDMVNRSGLSSRDEELTSLMKNAQKAVQANTCSCSLAIWKIQR
jgi:hypothetical protein